MFVIRVSSKSEWPSRFGKRGFTLVELLITVAMAVILSTIALPSLSNLVTNSRVSAQVNDFVGAVNLVRSEAVKRGSGVTICPSSDGATCGKAADWASGWIVFTDPDVDAKVGAGEELIHAFPGLSGNTSMVFDGNTRSITFLGIGRAIRSFTGTVATPFTGTFALLCPPEAGDYCRYICINSQGRPRVDTPAQYRADNSCGN